MALNSWLSTDRALMPRSPVEMAEKPYIKQATVSKFERRTDMYSSTLRSEIKALDRDLETIARVSNRAVRTTQFEELDAEGQPRG